MLVQTAKAHATQWIAHHGRQLPGFAGAFSHGSINWMPADAILPPTSDLDVMVVLEGPQPDVKLGKFLYQGVLLEVSFMPAGQLADAGKVLETPHLAGSFARATIFADPNGTLVPLQRRVAQQYATRASVRQRCLQTEHKIRQFLASINPANPYHDQVSAWLFGTGCTTHVFLVAALRNPTVRQRYLAARTLLAEYGNLALYERLLELLGCAGLSKYKVGRHMPALAAAFDAASSAIRTPIFFASDLSADARPIALGGSRTMIENGNHHEAVFWMVATYARCQKVFAADAPELYESHASGFHALLADLGIASTADMQRRAAEVLAFLPELQRAAEIITAATPAIVDAIPLAAAR